MRFNRSTQRYIAKKDGNIPLRMRIKEIAQARVRYGYKRIHVLLKREGWKVNHKAVYRLYREEGLNLRHRTRRKQISRARIPKVDVTGVNQCWALDFMSDALFNGRRFRTLTMMDVYSRECLNIYADKKITGDTVVDILDSISCHRGLPERIRVDNVLSLKSTFIQIKLLFFCFFQTKCFPLIRKGSFLTIVTQNP